MVVYGIGSLFVNQALNNGRVNFAPGAGVPGAVTRHIHTKYAPRPAAGDYAPSIKISSGRGKDRIQFSCREVTSNGAREMYLIYPLGLSFFVKRRACSRCYLHEVTIAPITSTVREIPSEVRLDQGDGMPGECAVNADHVQTVPKDRIGKLITALAPEKFVEIRNAVRFALDL
jgi:mRNA interferase MazF